MRAEIANLAAALAAMLFVATICAMTAVASWQ